MSVFCVFGNQVWGTVGGTDLARALLLKKVRAKRPFYKLISERGGGTAYVCHFRTKIALFS